MLFDYSRLAVASEDEDNELGQPLQAIFLERLKCPLGSIDPPVQSQEFPAPWILEGTVEDAEVLDGSIHLNSTRSALLKASPGDELPTNGILATADHASGLLEAVPMLNY